MIRTYLRKAAFYLILTLSYLGTMTTMFKPFPEFSLLVRRQSQLRWIQTLNLVMSSKEATLAKLLNSGSSVGLTAPRSGPLIQEVGGPVAAESSLPPVPAGTKPQDSFRSSQDDQPSILEMMMAAQRAASAEKAQVKKAEASVAAKTGLGAGFKKGFLGGAAKSKPVASVSSRPSNSASSTVTPARGDVIDVKKAPAAQQQTKDPFVFDEVQKAMEEDQNPLLKQLKQADWMTPDLISTFKSNQVLSRGFGDPKCMAAMQLLQSDPKEAQRRFANDPEVGAFLQEFGKLMAGHFEALGAAQSGGGGGGGGSVGTGGRGSSGTAAGGEGGIRIGNSSGGSGNSVNAAGAGAIQELGPLHAQALQRKKGATGATSSASTAPPSAASQGPQAGTGPADDDKVQKILADEELRSMLMDPELQRILVECSDPAQFQRHMQDPEVRRKIMKLQQAGLVGTAR